MLAVIYSYLKLPPKKTLPEIIFDENHFEMFRLIVFHTK